MKALKVARSVELPQTGDGVRDVVIDGEVFPYHVHVDSCIEPKGSSDELDVIWLGVLVDPEGGWE